MATGDGREGTSRKIASGMGEEATVAFRGEMQARHWRVDQPHRVSQ